MQAKNSVNVRMQGLKRDLCLSSQVLARGLTSCTRGYMSTKALRPHGGCCKTVAGHREAIGGGRGRRATWPADRPGGYDEGGYKLKH